MLQVPSLPEQSKPGGVAGDPRQQPPLSHGAPGKEISQQQNSGARFFLTYD